MHEFDKTYWEDHWTSTARGPERPLPANPHLRAEISELPVGTALDAGCGPGTEAIWLAEQGWRVTGVDISANALAAAADRAAAAGRADRIEFVEADVARWQPGRTWDLVTTHYAHPDTGQLAFYRHISSWVAPGGTLLIVGHRHGEGHGHGHGDGHGHGHGHGSENRGQHPEGATADRAGITEMFAAPEWRIVADYDADRTVDVGEGEVQLHDVVVRILRVAG